MPKSALGQAIGYALNNWDALNRYTTDGDLAVDNNTAERAIRPLVVGRKNYLFLGSDAGGRTAAHSRGRQRRGGARWLTW